MVGHLQIMDHPFKIGWTRILYSTNTSVPQWIPKYIVKKASNMMFAEVLLFTNNWNSCFTLIN